MRNTFCFFAFLLLVPFSIIHGQSTTSLGIDFFPNLSETTNLLGGDKEPKLSTSFGFFIGKEIINNRLEIRSGLNISNIGHQLEAQTFRWGTQHDGEGGFDPTLPAEENIQKVQFKMDYYHLELPVKAVYYFIDKKFRLYASEGFMVRYHLKNEQTFEFTLSNDEQEEATYSDDVDYRGFTFGFQSGIGLETTILKRWKVFMEPRVQFNPVRGTANGSEVKANYFSYGLGTGMKLDLTR